MGASALIALLVLMVPSVSGAESAQTVRFCKGDRIDCIDMPIPVGNKRVAGKYRRNCGYISCTFYFNKAETRSIARGSLPTLAVITYYTGPLGAAGSAAAIAAADEAMDRGYCLKVKVGPAYSTAGMPFSPQTYNSRSDGCV